MESTKKAFFVEVEKGVDWGKGYLDYNNEVVSDIKDAHKFDSKEDAENTADSFNIEYGRNGKIYARAY